MTLMLSWASLTASSWSEEAKPIVYSSIEELENSKKPERDPKKSDIILTIVSDSATFWIEEPGYPIEGNATFSETELSIQYPSKNHTQKWTRKTINGREWLLGPVALQQYETSKIIVPFDAIVRLIGEETTNNVPSAATLGVKAWKQK